jgi:Flp pilus assembly protein TadB
MSPTLVALFGSAAVVGLAASWVRPVTVSPRGRPRTVDATQTRPRPVAPCPGWFVLAVQRADLTGAPHRWFHAGLAALLGVGVLALLAGGPVLAVLAVGAVTTGTILALRLGAGRRQRRLVVEIPDSLDAVARSARAGSSVLQAIADLDGPEASLSDRVFVEVARRVERGEPLGDALERAATEHPVPEVRLAIAALAVGHETGAPPARAVEGVAATLRDRAALDREAVAHASQARASAVVLVVAPVAFSAFTVATDPRVGEFLFRSPGGWICLVLGIGLDGLGALWMRSIMATLR